MAKMPKRPPEVETLARQAALDTGRLSALLVTAPGPTVKGRYLHWDKLVYHEPPAGLSHEDWWSALKWRRRLLYRSLPLQDGKGRPCQYLETDLILEELHRIDFEAGGLIGMPDQLTTEARDRYYIRSLMEEAITSSQLEGAATTRQVAKEMIRSGRAPRDRSEQMILNNFLTMKRIGELKDRPLTKKLVCEVHRLITADTLDDPSTAGRFRVGDERVCVVDDRDRTVHVPPPAEQLEKRVAAMCHFANANAPFIHPVVRSIILHFWLAYDHPFVDGNGRAARALFYWSMMRHGYWLFEFISISSVILKGPSEYGRAFLYTETDENDLTYFIIYHMDVIRRAVTQLDEYLARKAKQLRAVEAELRAAPVLNHRQRALLSHALRHPDHRYTIRSHRTSHNVVYQTARTDLLDLAERGLLTKMKVGKAWVFSPADELERRLRELQ
jgi:Fic family protein